MGTSEHPPLPTNHRAQPWSRPRSPQGVGRVGPEPQQSAGQRDPALSASLALRLQVFLKSAFSCPSGGWCGKTQFPEGGGTLCWLSHTGSALQAWPQAWAPLVCSALGLESRQRPPGLLLVGSCAALPADCFCVKFTLHIILCLKIHPFLL